MIRVLTFAQLKEQLHTSLWESPFDQCSLSELQQQLIHSFPEAKAVIEASRFAVNQAYVQDLSQQVSTTDEVALIPPVSGG